MKHTPWSSPRLFVRPGLVCAAAATLLISACRRAPADAPLAGGKSAAPFGFDSFVPRAIGTPATEPAWITDLIIVDLDGDGRLDVVACDAKLNRVIWLRQTAPRVFEERPIGDPIAGPAHVEAADLNGDGHLDLLVAGMGTVPPSTDKTGTVNVLVNDGANHFSNRVLLRDVARVTYVNAADFNHDGKPDLIVGQFGYFQGEIRWMENLGDWNFRSHPLLDLPGTIHVPAADMNGDGHLDAVALVSQDSEEVHLFEGDGRGALRDRILWGSTNRDYGSSGLSIADVNRDGRPDILFTNGDGFDYATPGSRPWHGVQWLENLGFGRFEFHRLGDFAGAYSPVAVDLDRDGDNDVVVCSGFNDWSKPDAVSLGVFENDGYNHFTLRPLAHAPTHLVVVRAADFDGDGRSELVTGTFMFYPPFEHPTRLTLWEPRRP